MYLITKECQKGKIKADSHVHEWGSRGKTKPQEEGEEIYP
jgi:hypothetical protein